MHLRPVRRAHLSEGPTVRSRPNPLWATKLPRSVRQRTIGKTSTNSSFGALTSRYHCDLVFHSCRQGDGAGELQALMVHQPACSKVIDTLRTRIRRARPPSNNPESAGSMWAKSYMAGRLRKAQTHWGTWTRDRLSGRDRERRRAQCQMRSRGAMSSVDHATKGRNRLSCTTALTISGSGQHNPQCKPCPVSS